MLWTLFTYPTMLISAAQQQRLSTDNGETQPESSPMKLGTPKSVLCEVCEGIDLVKANDPLSWNRCLHHKSFASIRQSAANGCDLCQMIVDSALEAHWRDDWDDEEDGQIYY